MEGKEYLTCPCIRVEMSASLVHQRRSAMIDVAEGFCVVLALLLVGCIGVRILDWKRAGKAKRRKK